MSEAVKGSFWCNKQSINFEEISKQIEMIKRKKFFGALTKKSFERS